MLEEEAAVQPLAAQAVLLALEVAELVAVLGLEIMAQPTLVEEVAALLEPLTVAQAVLASSS